jgi:putative phosphoesterase
MSSRLKPRIRVGLVSDTHGLLRPEAIAALRGSDHVIHAGDIGDASILQRLSAIAPVTAVRGNNDIGDWAEAVPPTQQLDIHGKRIFVIHDLATLAIDPFAAGIDVVVSGHSHRPICERREGVLYVNPGSAGPRRFRLPIGVGMLTIDDDAIDAELVALDFVLGSTRRPTSARVSR